MDEREQIEQAISAIEKQRSLLGDSVVNIAISAMRERLDGPIQIAQQRKQVTVLFADVSGFTAMSENMDHEEVGTVINSLWTRVDKAILNHGGRIDKHIGDAVMALFGAPTAREDDPERAVRAALQVHSEIETWKQEFVDAGSPLQSQALGLRLRIGINTGPALIGTVGTTAEYTAIGDTVNLASRVETSAPAGAILMSHNTYRHVRGIFDVKALEPISVKGKSEPVQVYLVNGIRPRSFRVTTRGVEGIQTRTIGRESELAKLQSAFRATVAETKTHLVNVAAEAGTGKSRLLYEFTNWLENQPQSIRLYKGRATADMAKFPYSLVRDILSSEFEIQDSDRAAIAREKLEDGIEDLGSGSGADHTAAHFIGQLIGFDFSTSPHLKGILGDARQIRDLAFHYLAQYFADASRRQAVVIFLEDIHWADSASLDFFDYLLYTQPSARVLIVCLTRAVLFEYRPDWGAESEQRIRLDLQPLSEETCRQLVAEILQKIPEIPAVLVDLIVKKAEGSPFYIEELIKVLIEGRVIITDETPWRVELDKLKTLKVPATLTGLLQARLDTLNGVDRAVLQQASVVGRIFWPNVLERMQDPGAGGSDTAPALRHSLNILRTKELIYKNDGSAFAEASEFLFKNAALHDVTYESVLLRLRRIYHVQVAEGLVRLGGERVGEYAGRIGEHYEQAGEWLQAADWYLRAGKRAQDTYAPEAATGYYEKALRFYRQYPSPETISHQLEIHRQLGAVLSWQARYPEAIKNYESMFSTAVIHSDLAAQSHALLGEAACLGLQGNNRRAMEYAMRAEELARRANAQAQIARSIFEQGLAHFRLGEAQAALSLSEKSLAIHTELDNRNEMVRCMNLIGGVHHSLGHYPQAESYMENALALSQELGDRRQGMDSLNNLGVVADARGDYNTAFLRYNGALEIAREVGYRDGEIVFLTNRGSEQVALGNYAAAQADLSLAIELAGNTRSWILPNTYYFLAEASIRMGEPARALEAARTSLALAKADGAPEYIGAAYRALGMIAKELGRAISINSADSAAFEERDAEYLFTESLKVLEEGNMDGERARTLREWARYELRDGHQERGTELWKEARDIFWQLGAYMEFERMAELPS